MQSVELSVTSSVFPFPFKLSDSTERAMTCDVVIDVYGRRREGETKTSEHFDLEERWGWRPCKYGAGVHAVL